MLFSWMSSVERPLLSLKGDRCPLNKDSPKSRSQMKRDYPLDLSILLRGGKETNKDSLSNGE
jgi:hypothetical protein